MVWIKQKGGWHPCSPFFPGWGWCCGHFHVLLAAAPLELQPFLLSSAGQSGIEAGDALKDPFKEKQLQLP